MKRVILFFLVGSLYFCVRFFADTVIAQEQAAGTNFDLSTIEGREQASIHKQISPYDTKKCTDLHHTDGDKLTFCLATFHGTTAGIYNSDTDTIIVGSFATEVLIHEIVHATTLHYFKKGFTQINTPEFQEKIAYNAENLFGQIEEFKKSQ